MDVLGKIKSAWDYIQPESFMERGKIATGGLYAPDSPVAQPTQNGFLIEGLEVFLELFVLFCFLVYILGAENMKKYIPLSLGLCIALELIAFVF